MIIKKIINILSILFFIIPLNLFAESWYQIEIVVFDRISANFSEENWKPVTPRIRPDMIELHPSDTIIPNQQLVPFMIMDKKSNRMNGIYQVLKLSKEYRPLIHFSWQQPATNRMQSRYIHIIKRNEEDKVLGQDSSSELKEPDFLENIIVSKKNIDGAIRIRSDFFLHVDVELYYFSNFIYSNKDIPSVAVENYEKLIIDLKESRKIKLNEIHYFDNPIFGLIIQVSRIE
ncbi:MAG: hypothetical protein CMF40_02235 [Legionellales bacterium]|nr:hypothetical protein [Legionellales bacterium]